jgi:hypothetical protein
VKETPQRWQVCVNFFLSDSSMPVFASALV